MSSYFDWFAIEVFAYDKFIELLIVCLAFNFSFVCHVPRHCASVVIDEESFSQTIFR
jgi:hypothetical protein